MHALNLPDASLWASLEEEVEAAAAPGYAGGDDMEVDANLEEANNDMEADDALEGDNAEMVDAFQLLLAEDAALEADVGALEANVVVAEEVHLLLADADNNPNFNAPDHPPNMMIDPEIAEFFEDGFGVGEWFDLVGDDGDEEEEDDLADENVVVNGWWVHLLPPPLVPAPLLFGFVFPPRVVAPLAGELGAEDNPIVID